MNGTPGMTRRSFLRTTAAAGVTASLAARLGAQDEPAEPAFPFSTSTIMYPECTLEEALEEIAKTGCQAVDLWDPGGNAPVNAMDWVAENGPEALRALLDDHGLRLFAFSIYWAAAERRLPSLDWLKEAGGSVAVLGGGAPPDQPVATGIEALVPLVERADELGVKIAGENHGGSSLSTIASMREYVELAESPALGVALAPYHVMGEGESVPEAIRAIGRKLFFLYAWQRAEGMNELPGDGTLDFAPVLSALADVGYGGCLNIFTHAKAPKDEMTQAVIASRQYLERLLEQMPAPRGIAG